MIEANEKSAGPSSAVISFHRDEKSGKIRQHRQNQRDDRDETEAVGETIFAVGLIERSHISCRADRQNNRRS